VVEGEIAGERFVDRHPFGAVGVGVGGGIGQVGAEGEPGDGHDAFGARVASGVAVGA